MVQTMACSDCEVAVYNLSDKNTIANTADKVKTYGIKVLPAVVVMESFYPTAKMQAYQKLNSEMQESGNYCGL